MNNTYNTYIKGYVVLTSLQIMTVIKDMSQYERTKLVSEIQGVRLKLKDEDEMEFLKAIEEFTKPKVNQASSERIPIAIRANAAAKKVQRQ